ncbi:MAG: hypothetical protein J1F43_07195 [Muribaculaceae bacterium]|nr:hypothetical protein [Muribaculaceae bacterium]
MRYLLFAFSLLLLACSSKEKPETASEILEPLPPKYDITEQASAYADSVLSTLTLEERAGQCLMPSLYSSSDPSTMALLKRYIEDYHVGGIVLMQGDTKSAKRLADICEASKVPLFVAIDAEWGLGMRLEDGSIYPRNAMLSKEADESGMFDYGREIADESRSLGINMILGPVVDLSVSRKGVIGNRSFGSDPLLVSNYGVAYAKGLESGGVISVAKHFPGHGSTVVDSHKGVASIKRNISALDSLDLRPFRDYVNSGLTGIMAGHIKSLALDPDGNPASVSIDMLTSLLRDEMGFKGLILTDAFDMGGARGFSAADALTAGADLILCPSNIEREYDDLLKNLHDGKLDIRTLNERCRRILFVKYLFLN